MDRQRAPRRIPSLRPAGASLDKASAQFEKANRFPSDDPYLGSAGRVSVDKHNMTVVEGAGDSTAIEGG